MQTLCGPSVQENQMSHLHLDFSRRNELWRFEKYVTYIFLDIDLECWDEPFFRHQIKVNVSTWMGTYNNEEGSGPEGYGGCGSVMESDIREIGKHPIAINIAWDHLMYHLLKKQLLHSLSYLIFTTAIWGTWWNPVLQTRRWKLEQAKLTCPCIHS